MQITNQKRLWSALLLVAPFLLLACKKYGYTRTDAKESDPVPAISAPRDSAIASEPSRPTYDRSIEGYKASKLGEAIYSGDVDRVKSQLESGTSMEECLTDDTYIFDALYAAIAFGKIDVLSYLIESNRVSDINKTYTEEAECPLTLACAFRDHPVANQMADLLISKGANVNGVGQSGGEETKSPLFEAVKQNNTPLVKLLLEHVAQKAVASSSGETPLSKATELGNGEMVELLK